MNTRERWRRVYHFQPVDHVPDLEFGYWDEVYATWHPQGLPADVEDMMEHLTNLIVTTIERALEEVQFDAASFWEDMAYKAGPMISPRLFERYMVPRYKRITDLLRKYGVDVAYLDCDGNIMQLAGLWLEAGVNCMFPLEIRGGTSPERLRDSYGKQVRLMGGVDKTQLIAGKGAIRAEVKRVAKLVEQGGYIPHVDHRLPPDVTYENYLYYLWLKRDIFGIPQPEDPRLNPEKLHTTVR